MCEPAHSTLTLLHSHAFATLTFSDHFPAAACLMTLSNRLHDCRPRKRMPLLEVLSDALLGEVSIGSQI